ncbi:MAG: NUDIX hydrolase [Cellvibrionales bacterium]|nr:MAG: NUDIX hydrolase [Cellvibrionales bacterium]
MQPQQVFRAYESTISIEEDIQRTRFCSQCGEPCVSEVVEGGIRSTCTACQAVQYKNPQPAIAVLIVDGDRFVLGKRISKSLGHGQWCLPCGYVEFYEDYLSAAVREVKEETTLDIRVQSIISVVTNYLSANIHSLVTVLLAEVIGGELQAADGMEEVAWFPYTRNFPEMAFEADTHIISRYFETDLPGAPVDPRFANS